MLVSKILWGLIFKNKYEATNPDTTVPAYTSEPNKPNYWLSNERDSYIWIVAFFQL